MEAHKLTLLLRATDDRELTCAICDRQEVDFEFESRARGRHSWNGIHLECARKSGVVEPA